MKKIAFILPVPNNKIIGGYKVIYEYSNFLSKNGFEVTLFYNAHRGYNSKNIPPFVAYCIRYLIGKFGPQWFKLEKNIRKKILYDYTTKRALQEFDILIATAAETAKFVNQGKGKKIYFVQGFENWIMSESELCKTYSYNMQIITVSQWLKNKVSIMSDRNDILCIPNGIDKSIFRKKIEFKDRDEHSLAMLFHEDEMKGSKLGIKIILKLRREYPDLVVHLFGAPKRPSYLPDWINYTHSASSYEVSNIMNQARVFLCTSKEEGFGLTGLESLFCGCNLVSTDCKGIREYANEKNAFLCEVDNEIQIINSIRIAFDEDNKEEKMIDLKLLEKKYDLENSKRSFMEAIKGV